MEDQTRTFKRSKPKSAITLVGCGVFVALGFWMLEDNPIMGWLGISFFGLAAIGALTQFFPKAYHLKLDKDGFEVKSLFRSQFTKWSEVKGFRQGAYRGNKMIFFEYTDKHQKWKNGKKLAKFLSGSQGALASSYDIKTEELLELMKEYKRNNRS